MNIASLNLNLLVVLDALLIERHVSRAARRLGLSQPAVSNALAQLRTLLGDPLLVRGKTGMIATPRALGLQGPVHAGLMNLEMALGAPAFDPSRADQTFVITATDFVEFALLPKLLARINREAPGVRLRIAAWPRHRVPPTLETGEADLMIGFYADVPPGHRQQLLFPDRFVCIVRKGHPKVGKRLTLATYCALPHILVTSEANEPGAVDEALAKIGRQRTVALRTSHFLMVPAIVAATDFVAAISHRVAARFAGPLDLRIFPPPLQVPRGTVGQVWHERTDASPGHRWLRGVIAEVAAGIAGEI